MTILCLLLLQETAEDRFARLEKSLADAKSVSLKYQGEMKSPTETLQYSGRIRVKPGDKIVWDIEMKLGGESQILQFKSDGKKLIGTRDGVREEVPTREGSGALLLSSITRSGPILQMILLGDLGKEKKSPSPTDVAKVTGLKFEASKFEFDVRMVSKLDVRGRLWLDDAGKFPVKFEGRFQDQGADVISTVEYSEFSTDEIPDAEFAH